MLFTPGARAATIKESRKGVQRIMDQREVSGQISLYAEKDGRQALPVDALLQDVIAQARALNIPVSEQIDPHVRINCRATRRFGACFANKRSGSFLIEISDVLLTATEQACRQTLAHEVLHTCYGCQNHKKRWHHYADLMNRAYGYQIARTDSPERLGVENKTVVRYLVECTQCGAEIPRARRSRLIEHPEDYRCARCGGHLTVKTPEEGGT